MQNILHLQRAKGCHARKNLHSCTSAMLLSPPHNQQQLPAPPLHWHLLHAPRALQSAVSDADVGNAAAEPAQSERVAVWKGSGRNHQARRESPTISRRYSLYSSSSSSSSTSSSCAFTTSPRSSRCYSNGGGTTDHLPASEYDTVEEYQDATGFWRKRKGRAKWKRRNRPKVIDCDLFFLFLPPLAPRPRN